MDKHTRVQHTSVKQAVLNLSFPYCKNTPYD